MGNTESQTGNGPLGTAEHDDKFDGIDTLGYRVLGVQPSSPASTAGLVSFFDFLVGCNGQMLLGSANNSHDEDDDDEYHNDIDFPLLLRSNIGNELELLVFNIKSQGTRLVYITPSDSWGGTGLLGVTIRLDNYAEAETRLIRVLSVQHSSPAEIAGLVPFSDYLLGTTTVSFDSDQVLAAVLMESVDRVVEIYTYNTQSDVVRVVTLMPTLAWGGKGLLGAEVGTGYLHRLPKDCRGTLGVSFERKVRSGIRPMDFRGAKNYIGATKEKPVGTASGGNEGLANAARDGQERAEELVDSADALTCSASGVPLHMEPQMEMEPDPNSPVVTKQAVKAGKGGVAKPLIESVETVQQSTIPAQGPERADAEPLKKTQRYLGTSLLEAHPEITRATEPSSDVVSMKAEGAFLQQPVETQSSEFIEELPSLQQSMASSSKSNPGLFFSDVAFKQSGKNSNTSFDTSTSEVLAAHAGNGHETEPTQSNSGTPTSFASLANTSEMPAPPHFGFRNTSELDDYENDDASIVLPPPPLSELQKSSRNVKDGFDLR